MAYLQEIERLDKEIQKYQIEKIKYQKKLHVVRKGSYNEKRVLTILSDIEKGITQALNRKKKLLNGVHVPEPQTTYGKTTLKSLLGDFKLEDFSSDMKDFADKLQDLGQRIEQAANLAESTPQIAKSFKSMFSNGSKINLGQIDKIVGLLSDQELLGLIQELNGMLDENN